MKQKLLLLTMAAIAAQGFAQSPIAYPKTKTVNQVDEYFGVKVADPYRWWRTTILPKPPLGWKPKTR